MDFLNSGILDVLIGLALVYLLMATAASLVQELIVARIAKTRSSTLKAGIKQMLTDPDKEREVAAFIDEVYDHALIRSLKRPRVLFGKSTRATDPAYLPGATFARALRETAKLGASVPQEVKDTLETVTGMDPTKSMTWVEIEQVEKKIEKWFDDAMERVQGVWTAHAQRCLIGIGLILAAVLNVDTIALSRSLMNDDALRQELVAAAGKQVGTPASPPAVAGTPTPAPGTTPAAAPVTSTPPTAVSTADVRKAVQDVQALGLPIGWTSGVSAGDVVSDPRAWPGDGNAWFNKIIGILITAAAVSFGAPFWFDLLKRLVSVRNSGPAIPLAKDDPNKQPAKS